MNLKEALRGTLSGEELGTLKKSFDIVGDVCILELDDELAGKEKVIAEALMKVHKHVKTVCTKAGERAGKFRLREIRVVLGNGTETTHTEHGYRIKLDVSKAYFSPRESTERQRVAEQVKPGEKVLVLFSGVGPYALAIGKRQKCEITCVESNPHAVGYAKENMKLNKLQSRVEVVLGDARKAKLGNFDRVVMPLPEEARKYLDVALAHCKRGFIHLYGIGEEPGIFEALEAEVMKTAEKLGRKVKVAVRHRVLPYAPRRWKVCLDLEVLS